MKKGIMVLIIIAMMSVVMLVSAQGHGTSENITSQGMEVGMNQLGIALTPTVAWDIEKDNLRMQNAKLIKELEKVKLEKTKVENELARMKEELKKIQEQINIEAKENIVNKEEIKPPAQNKEKVAYLTFDDGPSKNTLKILDFLKENNIKATFFVVGKANNEDTYKRIVQEGHTLAAHSNTHQYNTIYNNVDSYMKDLKALEDSLKKITGVTPTIMRFPGGSNNTVSHKYGGTDIMKKIIPEVTKKGYTYFDWNVDSKDASKNVQEKNVIVNSVLEGAKNKKQAVILMHDTAVKTTTVEALPEIVKGLKNQGFTFKAITEETEAVKFK